MLRWFSRQSRSVQRRVRKVVGGAAGALSGGAGATVLELLGVADGADDPAHLMAAAVALWVYDLVRNKLKALEERVGS